MPSSEFEKIFARLRGLLSKQARWLSVSEDTSTRYCLDGRTGPATLKSWGGKVKRMIAELISQSITAIHA